MSEDNASLRSFAEPEELATREPSEKNSFEHEVVEDVPAEESEEVNPEPQEPNAPDPDSVEEPQEENDEEFDDDDFGSFDEASFEEFQAPEPQPAQQRFHSISLDNLATVDNELQRVVDQVFPNLNQKGQSEISPLIEETLTLFSMLSKNPRLNPPNWIKLKIRHSLLVKLGVPINLDELEAPSTLSAGQSRGQSRRRSINVNDIDWEQFEIPEFSTLSISTARKEELIASTHKELSRIEADIMNNTSEFFLQSSSDESVRAKLAQMQQNYAQLIELSSVWQDHIRELQNSQEVYESVVQSMVGYSQKLQRNEILESLKGAKTKKGKRTF